MSKLKTVQLEEAENQIKYAWAAGLFSGAITFVFALLAVFGTKPIPFIDETAFVDVALLGGLAYGVYRRNRGCAILLLIYFIVSKIYQAVQGQAPNISTFFFLFAYIQGVRGTLSYHKTLQEIESEPIGLSELSLSQVSPVGRAEASTKILGVRLIEKGWLMRKFEVKTLSDDFIIEYNGRGVGEGIKVDGQLVAKTSGYVWFTPKIEFKIGVIPAAVEIKVGLTSAVKSFSLAISEKIWYTE